MNPISPFLGCDRLYLRALVEADADGPYPNWFNDEDVCRGNSHHMFPYTPEAARAYIRQAGQTRESLVLAIILRDGDRHIGNIALQHIHLVYRSAEFSIVIGDKAAWGNGYSKDAGRLICDHGFRALNLHRIECGTFEDNEAMKRLALHLGMKEEGRRRQAAYRGGCYVDVVEYGVLRREYEERWRER